MITLQTLTFPDTAPGSDPALWLRLHGSGGLSRSGDGIGLKPGDVLALDGWFNLFNLATWQDSCHLAGLATHVTGRGRVDLRVRHTPPGGPEQVLSRVSLDLETAAPCPIDLPPGTAPGLIHLDVTATGPDGAMLTGGRFTADAPAGPLPRLAVAVTTFEREAQVRATVDRLTGFLAGFPQGDRMRVLVVDNGQSAGLMATDQVTPIANPNLGGSGGFARGLDAAQDAGCSHCLFVDDDAAFGLENIVRTYGFLALARDPRQALAGAMIDADAPWRIWENGARFDGLCRPRFHGTDLRDRAAVFAMEQAAARAPAAGLYGGWWFFAFAIKQVRHYPFPFFLRGDDLSFSLINGFRIRTLSGVACVHEIFPEKESPLTLYFDLRSQLVHPLVVPGLERGALRAAAVPLWFLMRSLLRFHYDSAEALLLAWRDMMAGPAFFDAHIDMAARRADIAALTRTECWGPVPADLGERRGGRARHGWWLGLLTLNGHLVPFSARRWDWVVLRGADRQRLLPAFGAARLTCVNSTATAAYTVAQSKARFLAIGLRAGGLLLRFLWRYRALKRNWRAGYARMTTRDYWQGKQP